MQCEHIERNSALYALKDTFNYNESYFYLKMTSDGTSTPTALSGCKSRKARFAFLACYNVEGTKSSPFYLSELELGLAVLIERKENNWVFTVSITIKTWTHLSLFLDWHCQLDRKVEKIEGE